MEKQLFIPKNEWVQLVLAQYPDAKEYKASSDTCYFYFPKDINTQYSYECLGGYQLSSSSGWVK
jgi:hypothetical protein